MPINGVIIEPVPTKVKIFIGGGKPVLNVEGISPEGARHGSKACGSLVVNSSG
jgi:hypothetical protein